MLVNVLSDDVEKVVALLLREAGDKLNEEVRTFPIVSINYKKYVESRIHHLSLLLSIVPADERSQPRCRAL